MTYDFAMGATFLSRLQRAIVSLIAAILSLLGSFAAFRWVFIKYWEWQHEGRPMKFTFWADERAEPLAFIVSGIVFYLVFAYLQCSLPQNERLPRKSLVLRIATAVVAAFICAVGYEFYVLRQIGK